MTRNYSILAALLLALAAILLAQPAPQPSDHLWYSTEMTRQYKAGVHSKKPETVNDATLITGFDIDMLLLQPAKSRNGPIRVNYLRVQMPDGSAYCFDLCLRHGEMRRKDCNL